MRKSTLPRSRHAVTARYWVPARKWTWSRTGTVGCLLALVTWALPGCELAESGLAQPDDVLVAEGYIRVGDGSDQISVFLHWTVGTGAIQALQNATVVIFPEGKPEIRLETAEPLDCLRSDAPDEIEGVCFAPVGGDEDMVEPGTRAELQVRLPDGRELQGGTVVPEDIRFIRPSADIVCGLPPGRHVEFLWNSSSGAWAYSAEADLNGLRAALEPQGIAVEEDSVSLLGLAVSESDTSIVFPQQFGVFDRFDLQQEVALALQEGLPLGSQGLVAVAALDRNYVNWLRGGNFNPSGAVRISSLRGDGIGVLASAVRRFIRVYGISGGGFPSCLDGG